MSAEIEELEPCMEQNGFECCNTFTNTLTCFIQDSECADLDYGYAVINNYDLAACSAFCSAVLPTPSYCGSLPTWDPNPNPNPPGPPAATGRATVKPAQTAMATLDARRTARPVATADPRPNGFTRVLVTPDEPVILKPSGGSRGGYEGRDGSDNQVPMEYVNLTIEANPGSGETTLEVKELFVQSSLEIGEGVLLTPTEVNGRASIGFGYDAEISLSASSLAKLPRLDLGETDEDSSTSHEIRLAISGGDSGEGTKNPIVQGRPFGQCNTWGGRVRGVPDGLVAKCEEISGGSKGKSI
jgi:hypothetical protein